MSKQIKLSEIAERINAHLKRFEKSKEINVDRSGNGMHDYYNAGACCAGSRIGIVYISYQGRSTMTKDEALAYLGGLDSGFVGRHSEFRRSKEQGK